MCDRFIWCVSDCRSAGGTDFVRIVRHSIVGVCDRCAGVHGRDIGPMLDYRRKIGAEHNQEKSVCLAVSRIAKSIRDDYECQ